MFGNDAKLCEGFVFFLFFCFMRIEHLRVLGMSVCSGVAFQPAHCIVVLNNLTAASMFYSVLWGLLELVSR
jgi:hypothetical protein